jgi:chromate transporter
MSPVLEVARLALRLGFTAFGGPAAHIAMLHDETVLRRKWLDEQHFLDLLGATNLIPGPNSTEMVIHIGYVRAGWAGLLAGGLGFILPAVGMVLALAWAYVRFGSLPATGWLLYGVKPVIVVIILQALWMLGRKALNSRETALVAAAALGLYWLGVSELLLIALGGAAVLAWRQGRRLAGRPAAALLPALPALLQAALPYTPGVLFLTFLKIGAVLYGSGYVLLAFLRSDFVVRLGWLTDAQLLDAIAVGHVTPGPVFTAATFVGYLVGGVPGGLLATLGIFLPSFVFVALSNPLIPRLRRSPLTSPVLDGVNAASLGLMAAVTLQLGRGALVDPFTLLLAAAAAVLVFRFQVNSTWLVLGGAALGWASSLFR